MSEPYSIEIFEEMAQQAREAEKKRVEEGTKKGSLSLSFPVALWITNREQVLESLAKVIDMMIEESGRTTGIFTGTIELTSPTEDRAPDGGSKS